MSGQVIELRPSTPQTHGGDLVERSVLMAMLLGRVDEVRSHGVTVDDFLRTEHQAVAGACFDIDQRDGSLVLPLVWRHLEEAKQLAKLPGSDENSRAAWLAGLIEDVPMLAHVGELSSQLRIDGARRRVHRLVSQLANSIGKADTLDIRLQLEHAERELERMNAAGAVKPYHSIKQSMVELAQDVAERAKSGTTRNGVSTGYTDWDAILRGWQPGSLNIIAARPSVGKAQPLDAKVLTPSGFRAMGDLRVGDHVMSPSGRPVAVLGVFPQGQKEVFRVEMNDGSVTECCAEHLWYTTTRNEIRNGSSGSVKTTADIARTIIRPDSATSPNHRLPPHGAMEFARHSAKLPLDPYVLGVILGDGSSSATARAVVIHNSEDDIIERVRDRLPKSDTVRERSLYSGRAARAFGIIRRVRLKATPTDTWTAYSRLGLVGMECYGKFIPEPYLMASTTDRLELLRGLMDTDGNVPTTSSTSVEFSTSSKRLADGAAFVARSLGASVAVKSRFTHFTYKGEKRRGAESFRVYIKFMDGTVPFHSKKHAARYLSDTGGNTTTRHFRRTVAKIESSGVKECQCISVDSADGLYMTDDFIPTHNTSMLVCSLLRAAQSDGVPVLLFSLEQARREIAERTVCAIGRVDAEIFRRVPTSADVSEVVRVTTRVAGLPMAICDATGISIYELCSRARRFARDAQFESKAKYRGIIGVDYLQIVKAAEGRQGREREVAEVAERLKALAKSLDMPVVALAQLNRDIEKRDNATPRLSDIRESGSVEAWADTVTLLDREELREPKEPKFPAGTAQLYVRKNRSGAIGECVLTFAERYTLFDDMTPRGSPDDGRYEDRRMPRERIPGEDDEAL